MQIGNPELEEVCSKAIVPALRNCGLDPKRIDKHNEGGLLKSEIIKLINESEIIVADLTNQRPNCYLEVGYAMGVDKFKNLILTARGDHNPTSPNFKLDGPRIHFDLSGYDILFWDSNDLDTFQNELTKRIQRRRAILGDFIYSPNIPWDIEWINEERKTAQSGLRAIELEGSMEVCFALDVPKPEKTQPELREAARLAPLRISAWSIGVFLLAEKNQPKPKVNGIFAEFSAERDGLYTYWALKRNGDFYTLESLLEDAQQQNTIFAVTRIERVTEALLYCARLYANMNIDPTHFVNISIKHASLKGRIIAPEWNLRISQQYKTSESEIDSSVRTTLSGIESNLVSLVKKLTKPLFIVFDFFQPADSIYERIVNNFVHKIGLTSEV